MNLTDQELQTILSHVSRGPWAEVNAVMGKLIAEVQRRAQGPSADNVHPLPDHLRRSDGNGA